MPTQRPAEISGGTCLAHIANAAVVVPVKMAGDVGRSLTSA
jgi:hypothetical protein